PASYTGFLIRRAQQSHVAAWQHCVSADVSSVQFGVLRILAAFPRSTQHDLCRQLDLDRSTVADVVARLERRGLIARARDVADRRRNRLELTELGREQLDSLVPRVEEMDALLTKRLSTKQVATLRELLNLVIQD
ncbi:MarR family winged helix-turn-helix transcriptional regulator, partial [Mycetocola sp.]|uniref:MarR family winged helix-turn-helix transcriptional regulator n=1 Tax=Mycetocola sp. TaxID=1871042 RepID=UPI003989DE62